MPESGRGADYVLHEAALGSVPRSIKDPITTNAVNIGGFLNMLVAARDAGVKRFIYAASSSTYGDSKELPKVEEHIGRPLSPYAITKYVNELYADVFSKTYGIECIGLRYFNVFGKRQDPNGPMLPYPTLGKTDDTGEQSRYQRGRNFLPGFYLYSQCDRGQRKGNDNSD